MSSIETQEDLKSFFDKEDFATRAVITGPGNFARELAIVFDEDPQEVSLYGNTEVSAKQPSIFCDTAALAGVKPDMLLTMPDLEPWQEGHGKTYEITPRILSEGVNTTRVYLKEL